jgi:tetratricopeptide (TPR) repeat protein
MALAIALVVSSPSAQTVSATLEVGAALIRARAPALDDPDVVFADLLGVATAQARSATAELLLREARPLVPLLTNPRQAARDLQAFMGAAPHGLSEQLARDLQTQCLARIDPEQARERNPFRDMAQTMLAIGPFGDSGDHYTGVPYPPELDFPRAEAVLEGRFGRVRTRVVRRPGDNRALSLADPGGDLEGCFYALHRVRAEHAVSAYLELTCGGSFQVFLNGEELGRVNRNRGPGPTTRFFPIPLRQGRNHVLVKTTTNNRNRIALRYIDGAGRTLASVQEIPADSEPNPWSDGEAPPIAGRFVDGFAALSSGLRGLQGEELATLRVALALAAFRTGHVLAGLGTLRDLERQPPSDPRTLLALAVAFQSAVAIPLEVRNGKVRQLVEGIGERLGNHHRLLMARATLLEDEDRREEAVRLLQVEVDAARAGPETFARLHGILTGLRFESEAERILEPWTEAAPADTRPVLIRAALRARGGDTRGALALLQEALARQPSDLAIRRRVLQLALDLGDAELALESLAALHAEERDSLSALLDRANLFRRLARTDRAVELYREIAGHGEAGPGEMRLAGDRLYELGDKPGALAAYRETVAVDPSQHQVRRLLRRLGGETEDFPAIARFRRSGDAAIEAFEAGDREKGSASSMVLDQMIVQVLPDGSMVQETHQIRRLNDLRGVERYQSANQAAGSADVVLLRTIATDGNSYVPNRVQGGFSMPRLAPGAFVEWILRDYQGAAGARPWRGPMFLFQSDQEPYVLSELVVILPPEPRGSLRVRGFPEPPQRIALENGNSAHVFKRVDVPRLETERLTPPLEELVPVVAYGEDGEVQALARRAHALALRRTYGTPYVTAKAWEIVADIRGDRARLAAIHRFVQQIPDGGGTTDPTAILLRGQGARFFLEAALLEAVGMPLQHALAADLREDLRYRPEPMFLGEERYEIPALLVRPRDGAPVWLFAGSPRYWPLGEIPNPRLGAAAILLAEGRSTLTRLPDGDRVNSQGFRMTGALTIGPGGSLSVDADLVLRGAVGLDAAEQIRNLEETIRELAARQLITGILPGWTLHDVGLVDLQEPGSTLRLRANLVRSGALKPAGNSWLLPLPLGPGNYMSTLGDRAQRQHSLRIASSTSASWEFAIDPGRNYRFAEVPQPVQVQHPIIDYSLRFRLQGRVLVVSRELYQKPGIVPAARFDEWLTLLRKLDQAEAVNLRLFER